MKNPDTMLTCNLVHIMGFQSTHTAAGPLFRLPLHGSNIFIMILTINERYLPEKGGCRCYNAMSCSLCRMNTRIMQMHSADQPRPDVVTATQRQSSGWPCYCTFCIISCLQHIL